MKSIIKSLYQYSRNEKRIKTFLNAFDVNYKIRAVEASNPNNLIIILEYLSKDKEWEVRYYVTRNNNTPIHVLEKLSNDKGSTVRIAVASNQNTPIHVLEKLNSDETNIKTSISEFK